MPKFLVSRQSLPFAVPTQPFLLTTFLLPLLFLQLELVQAERFRLSRMNEDSLLRNEHLVQRMAMHAAGIVSLRCML